MKRYQIEQTDKAGNTIAIVSGMGRNRGTLDSHCFSRSTARRWLREIKRLHPGNSYTISEA